MRNSVLALMMVVLSSASGSVVGYHIGETRGETRDIGAVEKDLTPF
jgi:membrane protein YqaA with SNARE-associated domain